VWSILPAHSLTEGLRFLTLSASGLVVVGAATSLAHEERNRILRWTAISTAVTVAALAIDLALGLPLLRIAIAAEPGQVIHLERFDRGTTVIGLLFWPVAFSLARERTFGLLGVLIAATVVALLMIPSSANRLAFLIAALLWLAAGYAPRLTRRAVTIATIALALALPMAVPRLLPTNEAVVELKDSAPWIKYTGLHRLLIWRFVSERVAERPLLGWGMDASRELPGGHVKLADTLSRPVVPENAEALPLHPHNAFLQWWVELGAVGVALCLAVVVMLLRRIAALGPREASAATAYAVAALTIAMLGYGFWQSWWLSTLWLAGTLVASATGARQTRRS
jgi:O-antigen ligase